MGAERQAFGGEQSTVANTPESLAFLGAVSAHSIKDIVQICSDVRFGPFALELSRTGYSPRSKVAWLAPDVWPLHLQRKAPLWHLSI